MTSWIASWGPSSKNCPGAHYPSIQLRAEENERDKALFYPGLFGIYFFWNKKDIRFSGINAILFCFLNKNIINRNLRNMPKMSTHILMTSRKQMTGFSWKALRSVAGVDGCLLLAVKSLYSWSEICGVQKIKPVAAGGAFGGSAPPIFFMPPQLIQTRKTNICWKCSFSICSIVTPTRNITARCRNSKPRCYTMNCTEERPCC